MQLQTLERWKLLKSLTKDTKATKLLPQSKPHKKKHVKFVNRAKKRVKIHFLIVIVSNECAPTW